jgi:hypothetical protein
MKTMKSGESIVKTSGCVFKSFFIFFFGLFIKGIVFPQQILFRINDNIIDYINNNPPQYRIQGAFAINTPDGRIDFLKYKAVTTEIDTKFLVQGSIVFGVMQSENNVTSFLYDINGDGTIDVIRDSFFLPFWVLTESQYTIISANNNLMEFLDNSLRMFNDDAGPSAAGVNILSDFSSNMDISVNNRDLFYGMLQYYFFARDPALALMVILELGSMYEMRFGNIHPLIYLHIAESMINLNLNEYAIEYINELLLIQPDFVPAKVYSWQLEEDPAIKQRKYNELKRDHPNHWIVRQI